MKRQSDKRKFKLRIAVIPIVLILCIIMLYTVGQVLPFVMLKNSMSDKGRCHLEVQCHISGNIKKYIPYLYYIGIDVETITFKMDKDRQVYHGRVYINNSDRTAMEFYKDSDKTVINISKLLSYIAYENKDILPDKLSSLADIDKDIYMTTDAIEELVGSSDVSIKDEILKIVDIKSMPSIGMIKNNMFSKHKYMVGLKFLSEDGAVIKSYGRMGIFDRKIRTITGVRSRNGNSDDFIIKCKNDHTMNVEMPDRSISRLEVIIVKELLKELGKQMAEKIDENIH